MKEGHIRVPHGWWYPELRGEVDLAGAFISSDAVLCSDEDEWLDHEQGVPHFKGFPGKLEKASGQLNCIAHNPATGGRMQQLRSMRLRDQWLSIARKRLNCGPAPVRAFC